MKHENTEQVAKYIDNRRYSKKNEWAFAIPECTQDSGRQVVEHGKRNANKNNDKILICAVQNIFRCADQNQDLTAENRCDQSKAK